MTLRPIMNSEHQYSRGAYHIIRKEIPDEHAEPAPYVYPKRDKKKKKRKK